jgi:hypothetical protein
MKMATYLNPVTQLAYTAPIWATLFAGSLVIVALVLSIYLLFEHLSAYKNPEVLLYYCWSFLLYYRYVLLS